jgi:hypothetical protein
MPRLTKAYYSRFHKPKPVRVEMTLDEIRKFQVDFNGALESETVSSIQWETGEDATVSIASATLSAGIASCLGEADVVGTARLYCLATLSSGRKLKQWFHIRVRDEADVR